MDVKEKRAAASVRTNFNSGLFERLPFPNIVIKPACLENNQSFKAVKEEKCTPTSKKR